MKVSNIVDEIWEKYFKNRKVDMRLKIIESLTNKEQKLSEKYRKDMKVNKKVSKNK